MTENQLKLAIADFLKLQYPNILFRIDYDLNALTIGKCVQIARLKSNQSAWPDIFIAHPNKYSHGLFVEVKSNKNKIYQKKNGQFRRNKHLQAQINFMNILQILGYSVSFTWSLEHFQNIMKDYLN